MTPLSTFAWFWRSWRAGSVTFAALFALGLCGFSAIGGLRHWLHHFGAPWYLWLLLPIVLIAALARWETQLIPDADVRRRWAWGIVLGAIVIVFTVAKFGSARSAAAKSTMRAGTISISESRIG